MFPSFLFTPRPPREVSVSSNHLRRTPLPLCFVVVGQRTSCKTSTLLTGVDELPEIGLEIVDDLVIETHPIPSPHPPDQKQNKTIPSKNPVENGGARKGPVCVQV